MSQSISRPMLVRAAIGLALYLLLGPAVLFIAAGTSDWAMAWLYVAMLLAATVGSRLIVLKASPDTLRERARFTESKGSPPSDRYLVLLTAIVGPVVTSLVAGLDHRFDWTHALAPAVQWLAAVLVAAGFGLAVWAMVANRYFSAVARVQLDRGQTVVSKGPYALVRHPAYAGGLLAGLAAPFMLAALWAMVPAILFAIPAVIRTAQEDRMLRRELPGYEAYTRRTRYRLLPGVW